LAIVSNVGSTGPVLEMREVQAAAGTLGLEVTALEIRRAEDIASAFEALKGRANALYVCGDPMSRTSSAAISVKRSLRPSPQRYSIAMLRPSIQPSSRSRSTKAGTQ
jgi:ABC-type uncharacterized transport system substrate-binding protein